MKEHNSGPLEGQWEPRGSFIKFLLLVSPAVPFAVRLQGVLLKLNTREKCSTLLMDYWGVLRFGVLARLFRQGI